MESTEYIMPVMDPLPITEKENAMSPDLVLVLGDIKPLPTKNL